MLGLGELDSICSAGTIFSGSSPRPSRHRH
jgi:hypothetical protein